MKTVTCVICGAKKGGANNWWVLLEAESERAVLIGPIDEAENLQDWRQGTARFHLCGAECLYRKLNGVLLPGLSVQPGAEKPAREFSLPDGPKTAAAVAASEDLSLRLITPGPLREILRLAKRNGSSPDAPYPGMAAARTEKIASPKLRENSAIGQGVTIRGKIQSDEPLYVNGDLAGTLELPDHRLTVGPNGRIRANVRAREVEVFGAVEGDVNADKIVVRKNARLAGDICTMVLVIEEGAFFVGRSRKAAVRDTSGVECVYDRA